MLSIQGLKDFGARVDQGLERCMGNEAFYLKMVGMVLADANFDKLSEAIAANDLDVSF